MMDFCEFIAGVGVLRATGVMGEIIEGSPGTALEQRQILSRLNRVSYCKGNSCRKRSVGYRAQPDHPSRLPG